MKYFNVKHLAIAICVALCIPVSPVQAAWSEQLMQQATHFIKTQAAPYMPYLQKPETYAVAAAAAVGAYFVGREIYWGVKSELPVNRVAPYVYAGVAASVQDHVERNQLQNLIMARQEIAQAGPNLIKKQVLDHLSKQYTYDYEFNRLPEVPRACDWNDRGIEVIDHSPFVAVQTGANCGYHAAFNAAGLYQLCVSAHEKKGLGYRCEALKSGPSIAAWKQFVRDQFDGTHCDAFCENIDDEVIRRLMTEQLLMPYENFTVIANPSQDPALFDESVPYIIAELQKGSKKVHAFLLGNMRDDFSVGGSGGHWIAAVVTTDGGLKVHIADSISGRSEGRRATIGHLVQLLQQNTEWAAMKGDIESRLETAKNVLNDNDDFVGCHKRLREVFDRMKVTSDQVQQEFRKEYAEFMRVLLDRLSVDKNAMVASIVDANKRDYGIDYPYNAAVQSLDQALTEMYLFLAGPVDSVIAGSSSSNQVHSLLYQRTSMSTSALLSRFKH